MRKTLIVTAILLGLAAGTAWGIDIQNFQPAIGTQNLLTLYTSTSYAQGQFGISVMTNYAADPLIFSFPGNKELRVVEKMITTDGNAAVGLFSFLEIGVAGSFNTVSGKDMDQQFTPAFPNTAMETDSAAGDVRAMMKIRILENKPGYMGIALVPQAAFPSGSTLAYSGAGALNAGARLVLDKRFDRVNIVVNGGYVYMRDPDKPNTGFDPKGRAEFGAGVTILAHRYVELLAEIYGRTVDYGLKEIDPQIPTEADAAAKFYAGPVHFTVGGGAGMNSGIGNPKWRAFAGIGLTIPKSKRDFTSAPAPVAAAAPAGPDLNSKTQDSDKDGLTNYEETHIYHTDPLNPDTDGDGLKDGEEVKTYHTDPLNPDTDGDGLTDYEEVKVFGTDPLKADTDGDTLSDGAEVRLYHTNPLDPDTDHDGVPDNIDGAPLEPETINGIRDEDGIPEVILAKKPSGVALTDSFIWIPGKIGFTGHNLEKVDKPSMALLKDVAAVMKEYPNIKIEVQGHCAPSPDKNTDQMITTMKAKAVAAALVSLGVKGDRVTSKGYGSDFPYVSNETADGRTKNDRIDMVIMEK